MNPTNVLQLFPTAFTSLKTSNLPGNLRSRTETNAELSAWKPMVAAQRVSAAPIHLQRNEINDPLTLAVANHNGSSRRVNGVCVGHAPRGARGGEELEPLLTLTYTYFGRTNERFSPLISRDLVGTLSQRRMRRATGVRLKFNYKTIFEAGPSIPLCGQISRVWLGCVRAQDPLPGHPATARKAQREEKVFLSRE